jgi:hypothetical protein
MVGRYPCGGMRRRDFLGATALAASANLIAGAELASAQEPKASRKAGSSRPEGKLGVPGPYPGRVVEIQHPGLVQGDHRNREAIKKTLDTGMCTLTGAPHPVDAWRKFVSPGEAIGIKVVPNGFPGAHSSPELVLEVIDNLKAVGIKLKDMVVFDRYRREFMEAGYQKILPEGVAWGGLTPEWDENQTTIKFDGGDPITGYDPDEFIHIQLVGKGMDPKDDRNYRSHLGKIVTKRLDKIICLPCMKDHHAAGATGALKNMSHGLVNNVFRSHSNSAAVAMVSYIPAVVSHPILRTKCVLHVMDATRGVWEGGPFGRKPEWLWDHNALLFATDPVAMDHVELDYLNKKRVQMGAAPLHKTGKDVSDPFNQEGYDIRQPQYIAIAGQLGLGNYEYKSPRGRASQILHSVKTIS